jgi:histidinol-phosphate aminotransferase
MTATHGNAPAPIEVLRSLERIPEPGEAEQSFVRLHRNERQQPLPEWFIERLRTIVTSELLTSYPVADALYAELERHLGVDPGWVLLTPGSDAATKALFHAYVEPGSDAVILDPSYAMYSVYAEMFGARAIRIPFDESFQPDLDLLRASIVSGVRLVILANPNQPTGTLIAEDDLVELAGLARACDAVLAVDEAYHPFSSQTIVQRVHEFPNLAVLRSFSKASGLAGLRLGYVTANDELIRSLFKVRSVHDVNAFAIRCALEVLRAPEVIDDYVTAVQAGEDVLRARAEAMGLEVLPTAANFALLRVDARCDPAELVARLRQRGYLIRGPFTAPGLAPYVRVTLGPPDLMAAFADVLESALVEQA